MGSHRWHITAASSSSPASPCSPWTRHPSAAPLLPSTPAAPPPSSAAHQDIFPARPSTEHAADENPRRRALSRRRQAFPPFHTPPKHTKRFASCPWCSLVISPSPPAKLSHRNLAISSPPLLKLRPGTRLQGIAIFPGPPLQKFLSFLLLF